MPFWRAFCNQINKQGGGGLMLDIKGDTHTQIIAGLVIELEVKSADASADSSPNLDKKTDAF